MIIKSESDAYAAGCGISYKLFVDNGSGTFVEWNVLEKTLQDEVSFSLTSKITFDRHTSSLSLDISNKDYEHFKATRFSDGSMKFQVKSFVAGASTDGPTADFQINFIEATVVDQCKDNKLHLMEVIYD
jgi:hypothetical protein